jgi:hypothetical protein
MKTRLICATLFMLATPAGWAADPCLPIINNDVTVDGIVVGADIGPGGTVPPSCPTGGADLGWAGVLGQDVPLAGGTASSQAATMFFAAHQGGEPNKINKIYLGVHVESAPDFTTNDKLTIYFQADATKGNWDTTNDFALVFDGIGKSAATPKDDGCADPGGQVRYYRRDPGNTTWVPQSSVPAGITFKTSYDYETVHDPEKELWELEIGIDVSALSIEQGGRLGIGAKLYLFDAPINTFSAYHYPVNLTPTPDSGQDFNPNQGGVTTPGTLQQMTVGNCGFDVVISSIKGTNNDGLPGHFTVLDVTKPGNFDANGNALKQNHFTADIKFVNPNNLTGVGAVPNSGTVRFHIKPWNGGFTGDFPMKDVTEPFTSLGQTLTVPSFVWPETLTQWNAGGASAALNKAASDHACLFVDLNGFTIDLPNGNEMQQNLSYNSFSTIKESFLVEAPKEVSVVMPSYHGSFEYILRAHWDNLAPKFQTGVHPFKYRITNAKALGLRSLGKGYYSMFLKPGEQKRVMLEITGGVMPNPPHQYKLSAQAGGTLLYPPSGEPPIEIPVKPGSTVSLVAAGLISIDPASKSHTHNDANGYADDTIILAAEPKQGQRSFLLRRDVFQPEGRIGALIGSFDGFRTSFVIGTDKTFVVPARSEKLALAINNVAGRYGISTGQFEINLIPGEPLMLPTRLTARGAAANPELGIPAEMQPASNLPQLVIDVGQRYKRRLIPTGYVAWAAYASHPDKR